MNFFAMIRRLLVLNPILSIVTFLWVSVYIVVRFIIRKREEALCGRKMSFMTSLLSHGVFPGSAGPVNHAINACLFMKGLPKEHEIKLLLKEKLIPFKRFRSVPAGRYFREVEVDLERHINSIEVENESELLLKLKEVVNSPLSHTQPVWEIMLIKNLSLLSSTTHHPTSINSEDSKTTTNPIDRKDSVKDVSCNALNSPYHCMIIRIGHCIGDGVSLVEVLSRLASDTSGQPLQTTPGILGLKRKSDLNSKQSFFIRLLLEIPLILYIFQGIKVLTKIMVGIPLSLLMAWGPYDSDSAVTPPLNIRKQGLTYSTNQQLVFGGPWSLDHVKRIKNALNGSINDVFMGAFAGAVRRYIVETDGDEESKRIRALMAYAFLRKPQVFEDNQRALTNNWTLLSTPLAVNETTCVARIFKTRQITKRLKRLDQALTNALVNITASKILPNKMLKQSMLDAYSRHSFVFANVPGAPFKVQICGHTIEEIQIAFAGILPQIEILTYDNKIFLSLVADPLVISKPSRIVELFADELRELGRTLGLGVNL